MVEIVQAASVAQPILNSTHLDDLLLMHIRIIAVDIADPDQPQTRNVPH